MKRSLSLKEASILCGNIAEVVTKTNQISVELQNINQAYFDEVMKKVFELKFLSECNEINLDEFLGILENVGGKPSEEIFKSERILLKEIDVYCVGLIVQLNRLDIRTQYSCDGHGLKKPIIHFETTEDVRIFKTIFNKLRIPHSFFDKKRVRLNVEREQLLEIALTLSEIDNYSSRNANQIKNLRRTSILEGMLSIRGSSKNESEIRNYIIKELTPLVSNLQVDTVGNILAKRVFGPGKTLLLSAHMDVVESDINPSFRIREHDDIWYRTKGILGADDRAGVAMIVNIMREINEHKFIGTIKIALTVGEEIGQIGAMGIETGFFEDVSYAISLDRRNGLDIVTHSSFQRYCSEEYGSFFEKASINFLKHNKGYRIVKGGISDLRVWSMYGIESVNISVGFYNEHTENEYLNIREWNRTHDFVMYCMVRLARINKVWLYKVVS